MRSSILTAIVLTIALSVAAMGAGKKGSTEAKSGASMKGFVVDVMCGKDMTGDDGVAQATKHKRSCALSDNCSASGYGLLSGGKWYAFDAEGSKKAQAYLESSKKKDNMMVEVTGKVDGSKYDLATIKDAGDAKEVKSAKKADKKSDAKKD